MIPNTEKPPEPSPEDKPITQEGAPDGTMEFTPDDLGPRTPEEKKELSQAVANAVEAAKAEKEPDWARGVYPELQKTMGIANAVETPEREKMEAAVPENIPETKPDNVEDATKALEKQAAGHEKKAKDLGFLDYWRWTGERIKSMPVKTRVGIGLGLAGAAILGSGGVALAAATGAGVWRILSSAGTFVVTEEALRASYEKRGVPRTKWQTKRHVVEALTISVLIGSGLAGQAAHNVFDYFQSGGETVAGAAKVTGEQKVGGQIKPPGVAEAVTEKPAAVLENYEVVKGDNLYKIIKANFPEVDKLSGARQTNAIENILAEIRKNPAEFGITDPDKINIGDEINIDKIREILKTKTIGGERIIEHAQNLSSEAVRNIESYVPPEIAEEAVDTGQTIDLSEVKPFAAEGSGGAAEAAGAQTGAAEAVVQTEAAKKEFLESVVSRFDDAPLQRELLNKADFESLTEARETLYKKLDGLFGTKGFLFFPKVSGLESPFWRDYRGLTLAAIEAEENKAGSVHELVAYVKELAKEYGNMPEKNETVEHFMKKALFQTMKAKYEAKYNIDV